MTVACVLSVLLSLLLILAVLLSLVVERVSCQCCPVFSVGSECLHRRVSFVFGCFPSFEKLLCVVVGVGGCVVFETG